MGIPHSVRIMAAFTVGTLDEIEFNEVMPIRARLLTMLQALCGGLIL